MNYSLSYIDSSFSLPLMFLKCIYVPVPISILFLLFIYQLTDIEYFLIFDYYQRITWTLIYKVCTDKCFHLSGWVWGVELLCVVHRVIAHQRCPYPVQELWIVIFQGWGYFAMWLSSLIWKTVLDYPGGLNVNTKVLKREIQESRSEQEMWWCKQRSEVRGRGREVQRYYIAGFEDGRRNDELRNAGVFEKLEKAGKWILHRTFRKNAAWQTPYLIWALWDHFGLLNKLVLF